MFAETQVRVLLSPGKVSIKLQLATQGDTCSRLLSLVSLGVANRLRQHKEVFRAGGWDKEYSIVIPQHQVIPAYCPLPDSGPLQRILGAGIEALRAGGKASQAEDRQPNRPYVSRIAMQPPNYDSLQPCHLRL